MSALERAACLSKQLQLAQNTTNPPEFSPEQPGTPFYLSAARGLGQLLLQLRNVFLRLLDLLEQAGGGGSAVLLLEELQHSCGSLLNHHQHTCTPKELLHKVCFTQLREEIVI